MDERNKAHVLALIALQVLRVAHHLVDVCRPHRLARRTGLRGRRQVPDPATDAFDIIRSGLGAAGGARKNVERSMARFEDVIEARRIGEHRAGRARGSRASSSMDRMLARPPEASGRSRRPV